MNFLEHVPGDDGAAMQFSVTGCSVSEEGPRPVRATLLVPAGVGEQAP